MFREWVIPSLDSVGFVLCRFIDSYFRMHRPHDVAIELYGIDINNIFNIRCNWLIAH